MAPSLWHGRPPASPCCLLSIQPTPRSSAPSSLTSRPCSSTWELPALFLRPKVIFFCLVSNWFVYASLVSIPKDSVLPGSGSTTLSAFLAPHLWGAERKCVEGQPDTEVGVEGHSNLQLPVITAVRTSPTTLEV